MEGVYTAYTGGAASGFDQPIIPIVSNVGAVTWEAGTAAKYPLAFQQALRAHFLKLSDISADQYTVNFAIPLHFLALPLMYLPDYGALYAGRHQPIQISLALSLASECLHWLVGADTVSAPSYTIKNLALLDVYTVLDP